ncbi:MAG: hypothetical protein ACJ72D_09300 [Marmoricola sp.]
MRTSLVVAALLVTAACGSSTHDQGPIPDVAGRSDAAEAVTCAANRSTTEAALAAYSATSGDFPPTIAALVPDFLRTDPSSAALGPGVRITGYDARTGTFVAGTACR